MGTSSPKHIIEPFGDRVLIELFKAQEQTTEGGLIVPATGPLNGRVLAVGRGVIGPNHQPMQSKVGDTVLIDRHYFGDKMTVNGMDQILISEGHILGRIKEE